MALHPFVIFVVFILKVLIIFFGIVRALLVAGTLSSIGWVWILLSLISLHLEIGSQIALIAGQPVNLKGQSLPQRLGSFGLLDVFSFSNIPTQILAESQWKLGLIRLISSLQIIIANRELSRPFISNHMTIYISTDASWDPLSCQVGFGFIIYNNHQKIIIAGASGGHCASFVEAELQAIHLSLKCCHTNNLTPDKLFFNCPTTIHLIKDFNNSIGWRHANTIHCI